MCTPFEKNNNDGNHSLPWKIIVRETNARACSLDVMVDWMDLEDQRRSCPGFLDHDGIWNNGFECPAIGNEIRVCCGSDSHRYCCLFEHSNKRSLSSTTSGFFKKFHLDFLTFPVQLFSLFLLIFIVLIIIIFVCYRSHQRRTNLFEQDPISTKEILSSEHFPFSPPHHQIYFNDLHPPRTTSAASSSSSFTSSARLPSEIHFTEQSINIYPSR